MSESNIFGLTGNLTNGADMIAELKARKSGFAMGGDDSDSDSDSDRQPPPAPTPKETPPDIAKEVEFLKGKLNETETQTRQLQSKLDHTNGYLQQMTQQQQMRLQQQPPAHEQPIQYEDPEIAAALNAIDQRNKQRFDGWTQQHQQQQHMATRNQEIQRITQAVAKVRKENPVWAERVSDEAIQQVVMPYIQDPRYHGAMDWEREFNTAARATQAPELEAENTRLKKELEQYKKGEDRNRQKQKENLSKVPATGTGSGRTGGSNVPVGDQIIADYRKGKKTNKTPSFSEFGKELLVRLKKQSAS